CVALMAAVAAITGCSSSSRPAATPSSTSAPTPTSAKPGVPPRSAGARDRVVVRGDALLDGRPFDSRFVGAVVLKAGLVTPCQHNLPPVAKGRYEITVLAETESSGCGEPGARIVLWTSARDKILFSTDAIAWPGNGGATTFAARYSSAAPAGAAPTTAQFNGGVYGADDRPLPPGTRVEAYVGSTRCGVASVRSSVDFTGYVLSAVGPDSIAGCTRGATLAFRINGLPAVHTRVVNTPPGQRESLDLILQ
ncbi:MAG: hypothetical protein QOH28_3102, partial [Actinomycetota bacterium]|nr:hypothetical protein [Actinomycetota bacterium]